MAPSQMRSRRCSVLGAAVQACSGPGAGVRRTTSTRRRVSRGLRARRIASVPVEQQAYGLWGPETQSWDLTRENVSGQATADSRIQPLSVRGVRVRDAPPTRALVQVTAARWLCESENCEECVIDRPQLVGREISHSITKSLSVDRSKLFDENTRRVACDGYFGSKRCRSGAP